MRERLRSDLLKGYPGKTVHPVSPLTEQQRPFFLPLPQVKNHSSTVRVDLGMALIHLDLDEMKSVLEVPPHTQHLPNPNISTNQRHILAPNLSFKHPPSLSRSTVGCG